MSLKTAIAPLSHRSYAYLLASSVISMLGDGVWLVALPWLAMQYGSGSTQVSYVVAAESAGLITCVLFGGMIADRFSRKKVIACAHGVSFIVLAVLGVAAATAHLRVEYLVLTAYILGCAAAVSGPAAEAYVPDLVPTENLHSANALESMAHSLIFRILGPTIGGVALSFLSTEAVIVINALSFLIAAGCVLFITVPPGAVLGASSEPGTVFSAVGASELMDVAAVVPAGADESNSSVGLRETVGFLRSKPWLWIMMVWAGVIIFLQTGPKQVLLPELIHDHFHQLATSYGLVMASAGIAALLFTFVLASRPLPQRYVHCLLIGWMIGDIPYAVMYFMPSYIWLIPLVMISACGAVIGNTYWSTMLQKTVPDRLRGRVISIDWLCSLSLTSVSALIAGLNQSPVYIATLFVLPATVSVIGTGVLLATLSLPTYQRSESVGA